MQAANFWDDPLQGNPRYQSLRTLSKSGKCIVQLAADRSTGERVAIKFTQRGWDASQNKYLLRQLLIHQELSACRHPHIVELKEVFLTPVHLAAVMEHVDGLNLQDFLSAQGGRVTEGLGRFLFQQLILALDFCHLRGKVSRGVKLANTMLQLSPGQLPLLKLADFGFSKDTGAHSAPQSQVGTALFVAPEVMHNFNNATYDGAAVDVWAAGIVLFILLFGRHPFLRPEDSGLSDQQQMLALFTRTAASQFCLLPEEAVAITPECADLLGHVLQTNPKTRYTMTQIQAHPWFLQNLPAGATDMNGIILAECATRKLQMNQPQEVIAALVRHGQVMDQSVMAQRFEPLQPMVPAAAAGLSRGAAAAPSGPAVAAAAAARQQPQQQQGGHSWGAPPPARLLAASTSSSDRRQEMLYKMQEQQQQLLQQQQGLQPPIAVHMNESTSSSHGSFMAAMQQQQQQQQLQQLALLQQQRQQAAASMPAGFLNQQLQQQLSPEVQQQLWQPQQRAATSANSSGATSAGGGTATAGTPTAGAATSSGLNAVSATISSQGLHIASMDALHIQPQRQQQQQQQSGAARDAAAAAMYMNGGPSLSKLNSDDLEKLISLERFAGTPASSSAAAAAAAAAADSSATVVGGNGPRLPMEVFASLNSLPHIPSILPSMRLESLLDPASNPLLGQPVAANYQQQQQQQATGNAPAGAVGSAFGSEQLPASKHKLAVNSNHGQTAATAAATADVASANPTRDGDDADPAAAAAVDGASDDHDGVLEIPEEYAAFLVDEDDIALARGDEGARLRRKRLLSNTGAGVSSLINLRNLSEMLLEGGASQAQLEEGSLWHKICRDMSFRERSLVPGGGGVVGGLRDLAGDDDDDADLMQSLQGLRDMSITKDFGS